jgi:hypothetical protein
MWMATFSMTAPIVAEPPDLPGKDTYPRIGVNLIAPSLAMEPKEAIALIDL